MLVSVDYLAYVIEQLASLGHVSSRRMFGGVGLYADGLFFAILDGDSLYFKTDASNRGDYEQRGSKPFCPFPDKPTMVMNYHDVPADLLDEADELCCWARKSVAVAWAASKKKSATPRRKKSTPAVPSKKVSKKVSKKRLKRS
ncbi:MAG: TfoX/Sxy family protein [Candidatus Obscuribacterales bacterium]|nr:TfoX/Sxy family protein [Steroidobacteraceae bacterium]